MCTTNKRREDQFTVGFLFCLLPVFFFLLLTLGTSLVTHHQLWSALWHRFSVLPCWPQNGICKVQSQQTWHWGWWGHSACSPGCSYSMFFLGTLMCNLSFEIGYRKLIHLPDGAGLFPTLLVALASYLEAGNWVWHFVQVLQTGSHLRVQLSQNYLEKRSRALSRWLDVHTERGELPRNSHLAE